MVAGRFYLIGEPVASGGEALINSRRSKAQGIAAFSLCRENDALASGIGTCTVRHASSRMLLPTWYKYSARIFASKWQKAFTKCFDT